MFHHENLELSCRYCNSCCCWHCFTFLNCCHSSTCTPPFIRDQFKDQENHHYHHLHVSPAEECRHRDQRLKSSIFKAAFGFVPKNLGAEKKGGLIQATFGRVEFEEMARTFRAVNTRYLCIYLYSCKYCSLRKFM